MSLILRHSFLISLFVSHSAFATLGEKPLPPQPVVQNAAAGGSVSQIPVQKLQVQKIVDQGSYTIQENEMNGSIVREYVLPNGIVFAVTWRGIKHPDLAVVLGNYHTEFEKLHSKKAKSVGRAPLHVNSSKVSVKMHGHMRDVRGEAYDPALLPANFSIQDLK